jgi:N-acetylglucosamine kinase-like BadF-type ATPase
VGVDGGGTQTRAVVVHAAPNPDGDGALLLREVGRGYAPSCNHYSVGWEAARDNLLLSVHLALEAAGLPRSHACTDPALAWGLGLAGVVSDAEEQEWAVHLRGHIAPGAPLRVGDDALAAQSGAFAGGAGAILIAGTGANAFGRDADGREARADGLGPFLGDRGSGYWIAESALRAVARHHDGTQPCPALHDAVLEFLGATDAVALVPIVHDASWSKDRAAALVPVVAQAAQDGDETAAAILNQAGTELAHSAVAVLRKLNINSVAPTGGVLENVPHVRAAFERALCAALPSARTVAVHYDGAVGAALLAQGV